MNARLSLALTGGVVSLPDEGAVLLLRPPADLVLDGLPLDRVTAQHGFRPDFDALLARGLTVAEHVAEPVTTAIVFATRAKALTRALLAKAIESVGPGGTIIVDGAKSEGIDSVVKLCRTAFDLGDVFAKAHGKCFSFVAPGIVPDGWAAKDHLVDGFVTRPGVFSADGVDKGSALLAPHLNTLSGRICDLGAGWGFLASAALQSDAVKEVALVEAEQIALDCAKDNITDARASFHWADATRWTGGPFDVVISNPPFHTSRKAEPGIGKGFIEAAARVLTPRGRLLMVANRHLPYEATIREAFAETLVLADQGGYKVIEAMRPKRRTP